MKKGVVKNVLAAGFLITVLALGGAGCRKGGSLDAQRAFGTIDLEFWTVFNSPDDFKAIIADYKAIRPNIRVNVKKFRFDEYEDMLINALAEDRGPDIFSVHNTRIREFRPKLMPLPSATTLAVQTVKGTVKKEVVTGFQTTRSMNEAELRADFLEQVYKDVYLPESLIVDGETKYGAPQIYALPVGFDTMVMYFNRDILDNAGISQPAKTWNEFQQNVTKVARFDSNRNILTAGAAIGTSENVPRATDILSLLMMQNGAQMIDNGVVNFHRIPNSLRGLRKEIPGEQALDFYTSFANENRQAYTWNEDQADGFEAFLQGKVAYFFGYSYHKPQIEGLAPKLNFGVTNSPIIQGNQPVFFANYWAEGVSRKTRNVDAAWDFLQFMTSAAEAQKYLASSQRVTARRDLLSLQEEDPELFIFAAQALNSESWYTGMDAPAAETILKQLIDDTLAGTEKTKDLLELASQRVQQTMR